MDDVADPDSDQETSAGWQPVPTTTLDPSEHVAQCDTQVLDNDDPSSTSPAEMTEPSAPQPSTSLDPPPSATIDLDISNPTQTPRRSSRLRAKPGWQTTDEWLLD